MAEDGKTVISTKKEELTTICESLQIQVENPLNILTQDTAKMFLSNSTPVQKYDVCQVIPRRNDD